MNNLLLNHQKYSLLTRLYTSKTAWSYAEAKKWQQSFNQQKIPKDNVTISFSRSSGPGGQNVNKVSTKVDLRFALSKASWLPDYAKGKLKSTSQLKKSKDDELIITSDKTRSQAKNIQDCYEKLVQVIKDSVAVTKEPDQATLARVEQLRNIENRNRKEFKKKQSQKKSDRRSRGSDY